jgi:hypothetical protein
LNGLDDSLLEFYRRLAGTGLPTMIGGSIGAMAYGEPRATLDIDLIVQADRTDLDRLLAAFSDPRYFVPPRAVIEKELTRREGGSFQIYDKTTALKADIYLAGADPLQAYGLAHRRTESVAGQLVTLAPATYLIAIKLRYYTMSEQTKHLRDIRSILAISPELVDHAVVERYAREYGAEVAWRECQATPGEELG